ALQAFRSELEEPRERDPERKTDRGGDEEPARRPVRQAERRAELRKALPKRPNGAGVEDRRANDVAALEFGEQAAAHAPPPGRRWAGDCISVVEIGRTAQGSVRKANDAPR